MRLASVREGDQRQQELVSEYILFPALQNGGKFECIKKRKLFLGRDFFLGCNV